MSIVSSEGVVRAFGSLVAILGLLWSAGCKEATPVLMPRPAAGWQITQLQTLSPEALRAIAAEGEGAMVALWASWCEPCIEEMREFEALSQVFPKVRFIALATEGEEGASRAQAVLDRVKPTFPQAKMVPGEEMAFLKAFGLEWDGVLPKTFVVKPSGESKKADSPLREDLDKALQWLRGTAP